jgi:hypothetical protein
LVVGSIPKAVPPKKGVRGGSLLIILILALAGVTGFISTSALLAFIFGFEWLLIVAVLVLVAWLVSALRRRPPEA